MSTDDLPLAVDGWVVPQDHYGQVLVTDRRCPKCDTEWRSEAGDTCFVCGETAPRRHYPWPPD